jgi:hypothetical protein
MKIRLVAALTAVLMVIHVSLQSVPVSAQVNASPVPYMPTIDPANFTVTIDNPWNPLVPGSIWVYDGPSDEGVEHNEVTVTTDSKVIMGVTCVVVHDAVYTDGELTEDTLDYFAQDLDGNVWYFGEDSSEIEDGKVVSTEGSWMAGVEGALPGIQMLTSPQVSLQYRQEYLAGEAEDMAQVIDTHGSVSIPFGDFDPVLIISEWNPFEPGIVENKTYAQGIGLLTVQTVQGGDESITLTSFTPGTLATPTS